MSKVVGKQGQLHRTINLRGLGAHLTNNRQLYLIVDITSNIIEWDMSRAQQHIFSGKKIKHSQLHRITVRQTNHQVKRFIEDKLTIPVHNWGSKLLQITPNNAKRVNPTAMAWFDAKATIYGKSQMIAAWLWSIHLHQSLQMNIHVKHVGVQHIHGSQFTVKVTTIVPT